MPEEIVDRLMNEKTWSIYLPPELDLPENHTPEEYEKWKKKWPKRKKQEVKIHHEERKKCRSSVRNLNRKDRISTLHLGYSSLYLASGFLKWYPPELPKKEWRKSPLFISEAYIHIPKGDARPEIGLTQGFWTLNPTIKRILQSDYNVNLAKVKDEVELPNKEFDRILKAVKLVIPGAEILDELVMDIFHTKKETIFRDLEENQKAVIDHPFVKALCHDGSKKSAGS